MNDDYLWDKSGEPDPEIEQLEQLLGNLRHKHPARGLPLPLRAPLQQRRTFTPFLAAAAVLLMMIAAGLWFAISSGGQKEAAGVLASSVEPERLSDRFNLEGMSAAALQRAADETEKPEPVAAGATIASRPDRPRRAPAPNRREPSAPLTARATPANRAERISEDEGVAAREQLIKALHLTSSKLNQVQKRMQDNKSPGPVS